MGKQLEYTILIAVIVLSAIIIGLIFWNNQMMTSQHNATTSLTSTTQPNIPITFDSQTYEVGSTAMIFVYDPTANSDPNTREKFMVTVSSDTDPTGFQIQLEESTKNSSKFVSHPYKLQFITSPSVPSKAALQVSLGDKIHVVYSGSTSTAQIIAPKQVTPVGISTSFTGQLTNSFSTFGTLPTTTNTVDLTAVPSCLNDNDNDGICDEWEDASDPNYIGSGGLAIPYGSETYQLPCNPDYFDPVTNAYDDCPDPYMKDVFMELDYMQSPNINQQPSMDAINDIKKTFYQHNIRLHVYVDDDDNPTHQNGIGFYNDTTIVPGNPTDTLTPQTNSFFGLKQAFFGTLSDRTCGTSGNQPSCSAGPTQGVHDWLTAKRQVFHYGMFIHGQKDNLGSSGWGEIYGNDFVVSMGAFNGGVGDRYQQEGTLMHELGHNLNLGHGGDPSDAQNCKPNYLSVMSYTMQFPYFVKLSNWNLDYSERALRTLDENNLNETTGIGTLSVNNTAYGYTLGSNLHVITGPINSAANGAIDWDGETLQNIPPGPGPYDKPGFSSDINTLGIGECNANSKDRLYGHEDWNHLRFDFQSSSRFSNGITTDPSTEQEMTRYNVDKLMLLEYGINSTGQDISPETKIVEKKQGSYGQQ